MSMKPSYKNWGGSRRILQDDSGVCKEIVTHAHEPGIFHTRTFQPDRNKILENNARMRIERPTRDFSFGRWIGNIPFEDLQMLKKKYPEINAKDPEIRQKALMKLLNSPEGKKYLIVEKA